MIATDFPETRVLHADGTITDTGNRVREYQHNPKPDSWSIFNPPKNLAHLLPTIENFNSPITSRRQLYDLPIEARQKEIVRLANEHHNHQIKIGHVVNNERTDKYERHAIPEVNAVLFHEPAPTSFDQMPSA